MFQKSTEKIINVLIGEKNAEVEEALS